VGAVLAAFKGCSHREVQLSIYLPRFKKIRAIHTVMGSFKQLRAIHTMGA